MNLGDRFGALQKKAVQTFETPKPQLMLVNKPSEDPNRVAPFRDGRLSSFKGFASGPIARWEVALILLTSAGLRLQYGGL